MRLPALADNETANIMLLKYNLFSSFKVAMFYVPILVVYLKSILANPLEIGILLSIKTISSLIFEIPTGFVADRVSRKLSILISLIINAISIIIFIATKNFIWLCIAQILFGLAETFDSGASTSLLYDNLKQVNSEEYFENAMKNLYFYKSLVLFASFIIGGYTYNTFHALPFVLAMISVIVAFFICTTITEYEYRDNTVNQKFYSIFLLKQIFHEPKTVWLNLIFSNIIKAVFYSSYLFLIPLFLKYSGINEKYFGVLFSIGVLIYGFGGKYSGIFKDSQKLLALLGPVIMAIVFFITGIIKASIMCVILLLLLRLVWGVYTTIYNIHINRKICNSAIRATAISIGSGIEGGVSSLLIMLYGFLMEFISMQTVLLIIGCFFISISLIFLFVLSCVAKNNSA